MTKKKKKGRSVERKTDKRIIQTSIGTEPQSQQQVSNITIKIGEKAMLKKKKKIKKKIQKKV